MMDSVEKYWQEYCKFSNQPKLAYKESFQFGASPDWLAELVVEGKKVATTSALFVYELYNIDMPSIDDYSIVLNSKDEPVAIIRNTKVEVVPFNEVSEEFALSEGEGDFEYWWNAHLKFFKKETATANLAFREDMLVVCESFEKVYPI